MTQAAIRPNETTVPLLPCADPDQLLEFYQALGFEVTYRQTKPYLYLAFRYSGFELHFGNPPSGMDPAREESGGALVMVDAVASYHAAFTAAIRAHYGKMLSKGLPRITRYRPGATRFTIVDPSGNSIIVIQRDEPADLEYGGSKELTGLARALDNARILREFKTDDRAAYRAVNSAVRRHGEQASAGELALAYANLVELSVALDEPEQAEQWRRRFHDLDLPEAERARVVGQLGDAERAIELFTQPPD